MNRTAIPMTFRRGVRAVTAATLLAACSPEPPPHTVIEFIENPRLLEATMLRCAENRAELRYTPNCLNAREAVDRLAAEEEAATRAELEAQSERKRDALRRAQRAAADARAQAEELARQRAQAEYLGQFESVDENTPATDTRTADPELPADNEVLPPPEPDTGAVEDAAEPPPETAPESLEAVREELQRRQQEDNQ